MRKNNYQSHLRYIHNAAPPAFSKPHFALN